jgi:hypothetical protein
MTTPYEVLSRITSRPPTAADGERCEMCSEAIPDEHRHVVNLQGRQLMCVCTGCHLLFTDPGAELRYRAVPNRYLEFTEFAVGEQLWATLQIPVELAFLFRNSALQRMVVFYPGPAGATESELDLDAWEDIAEEDARVRMLTDDVEALLMRSTDGNTQCFLVPVDACYEVVGGLRRRWRGLGGGQEVSQFMDTFFDRIGARAKAVSR